MSSLYYIDEVDLTVKAGEHAKPVRYFNQCVLYPDENKLVLAAECFGYENCQNTTEEISELSFQELLKGLIKIVTDGSYIIYRDDFKQYKCTFKRNRVCIAEGVVTFPELGTCRYAAADANNTGE